MKESVSVQDKLEDLLSSTMRVATALHAFPVLYSAA